MVEYRNLLDQVKGLTRRQTDRARELELLFLEIVLGHDQPLSSGFDLDLRPQHVDLRDNSGALQVGGQCEERLGGVGLGADRVDATRGRHRLQVQARRHEHDDLTSVPRLERRRIDVPTLAANVVERADVDDRL